ncbi:thiamine phosphate synthase [Spirosoma pomorum]
MSRISDQSFRLIGITNDSPTSQDGGLLDSLLANGLDYLYWRNPHAEAPLPPVASTYRSQCLIAAPSPGLVEAPFRWHLKEMDRQLLAAVDDQPSQKTFSTSIHQLGEWPELAGRVKVVFYSPLFSSISKPGYGPTVSLDTIARQVGAMRQQYTALPLLIGLGGITADTVSQVRQAGFDGAALMGALWQTPDPVAALQKIRESIYL